MSILAFKRPRRLTQKSTIKGVGAEWHLLKLPAAPSPIEPR
jgi:hypothetical protein